MIRCLHAGFYSVLIFASAVSYRSSAQLSHLYGYMQMGAGGGSFSTLNIGGTIEYNNWAVTYDHIEQNRKADNIPADYLFFGISPQQLLEGSCIEGARIIYFAGNRLRFLARGGAFIGSHTFPEKFIKSTPLPVFLFPPFPSNYDIEFQTNDATGVVLHPTLEWPYTVPFGMSLGGRIIITGTKSTVAIDFNILLGKVRRSKKRGGAAFY